MAETSTAQVLGAQGGDEFGRVEARGIDRIPPAERHGRPRELFCIWAASNVNYLYILLGGLLMVFGLNIWEGLAAVVIGNLFWVAIGAMAASGPVSGTPSSVIMRAMFGVRGNKLNLGLLNWPIFIAYEAINLSMGALAGFAAIEQLGLTASGPIQIVIVAATAVTTLVISVYGHATIVRMSGPFTAVLAIVMTVLGIFVLAQANWDHQPPSDAPWGTFLAGIAVIAAAPLSLGMSADYARYLPENTSRLGVATWTGLGGFIPSVLLGAVGVLAGSVIDMTDPQTSLAQILPAWFYPLFLLFVVLGSMTNNVLTMYSSGLYIQAIGIPLRRSVTVLLDGILGVALACYALFISDFTGTLSNVLELSVVILGPSVALYIADQAIRRNRYDGVELHDQTRAGRFWYTGGFNLAGVVAFAAGAVTAALCVSTTLYIGPVAEFLDGGDLAWVAGPLVAGGLYVVLMKVCYPSHVEAA